MNVPLTNFSAFIKEESTGPRHLWVDCERLSEADEVTPHRPLAWS
jgi:hypothetical protein